jgi:hypothetical protein
MTKLIRPDWSGTFGSPQAQIKACMNMLGQRGGHVRPPLLPIDNPGQLEMLRKILEMRRDCLLTRRGRHRPQASLTIALPRVI